MIIKAKHNNWNTLPPNGYNVLTGTKRRVIKTQQTTISALLDFTDDVKQQKTEVKSQCKTKSMKTMMHYSIRKITPFQKVSLNHYHQAERKNIT